MNVNQIASKYSARVNRPNARSVGATLSACARAIVVTALVAAGLVALSLSARAASLPVPTRASRASEVPPFVATIAPACSGTALITMRNNTSREVGFDRGVVGGDFGITMVQPRSVTSIILTAAPGSTVLVNSYADGPELASAVVPACGPVTGDMVINRKSRKGFVKLDSVATEPLRVRFLLIKGRSTTPLPPLVINPGESRTFGFEGRRFAPGTTVKVSVKHGPILDYAR